MPIYALGAQVPTIAGTAFIAATAVVIGDVAVGPASSVWYGAVLRGDLGAIRVGSGVAIEDGAILHGALDPPTVIEDRVVVGHRCVVHSAVLRRGCLIGTGALVLDGAEVGAGAFVAAGAVVSPGSRLEPGHLYAGVPARDLGPVRGASARWLVSAGPTYDALALRHEAELRRIDR